MRLRLFLVALIALTLISGKGNGRPYSTITIINKSGQEIAVGLINEDNSRIYYLPVPKGDRAAPEVFKFSLEQDQYRMRIYYMETYDPKTGVECRRARAATLLAYRNIRITVTECVGSAPTPGEPSMVKMGRWRCIY
jgi:hypothetical protein